MTHAFNVTELDYLYTINLMSQNILTNLVKIRHLEERIKILEQRNLHSAENNNY